MKRQSKTQQPTPTDADEELVPLDDKAFERPSFASLTKPKLPPVTIPKLPTTTPAPVAAAKGLGSAPNSSRGSPRPPGVPMLNISRAQSTKDDENSSSDDDEVSLIPKANSSSKAAVETKFDDEEVPLDEAIF